MDKEKVAKHKIRLDAPPEAERLWHKTFTKSIRSKVLQKLVLLWYNLWIDGSSELHQAVKQRLIKNNLNPKFKVNYAYEVKPKEVMKLLNCSRRTAIEYIEALRIILI